MDSINANQPEDPRADLRGTEALEKFRELVKQAKSCFFCTAGATGDSFGTRPMSVQRHDEDGTLWFLSARDSNKNAEIAADPQVALHFQGGAHSDFLTLRGRAEITTDRATLDELWDPMARTWFTEGKDDPRLTAIRVVPERAYYWDTKHGTAVAGVKMMIGAAIGVTLDDSVEGTLQLPR